jgi:hypothetical protein
MDGKYALMAVHRRLQLVHILIEFILGNRHIPQNVQCGPRGYHLELLIKTLVSKVVFDGKNNNNTYND